MEDEDVDVAASLRQAALEFSQEPLAGYALVLVRETGRMTTEICPGNDSRLRAELLGVAMAGIVRRCVAEWDGD